MKYNIGDFYTFPCGCKFEVIGPPPLPKSDIPTLRLNWDDIPLDCPETYKLLSSGKTLLVFQLEKGGGRAGSKELKPENIEHIAALGAVLRPGAANSLDSEGISTTKHYYKRKNKEEEVKSYQPALDPILGKTYNCLIYQEQSMKIAEVIAGFNKQDADSLRKAIGKKLPEEMAKVEKWFLEGAKKRGVVTDEQAKEIFGWIRESQRYSFNKCVSPDTVVETPEGLKFIEEVNIGDKVNSPYGFLEVLNIYENGVKEVFEVVLESGKSIKCTIDHKFLCDDEELHSLWEIIENNLKIMCQEE